LNDKEIALIIHNSSGNFQSDFVKAVWNISVPGGFSVKVLPAEGAVELSTHGICLSSAKRCGKILRGLKTI